MKKTLEEELLGLKPNKVKHSERIAIKNKKPKNRKYDEEDCHNDRKRYF